MTQRDYEEQPEAPDLGSVVQEGTAETLVGPPDSDVLDAGYVPPDRPFVADDEAALTRSEDHERRLGRERPDPDPDDPDQVADSEPDRAPRFEARERTADGWQRGSLAAADDGVAGGAASAEEAAVHVRGEDDDEPER